MELNKIRKSLPPSVKIVMGFILLILLGTILLCLPISSKNGQWLSFVDSLFTSTSAVCVTGLIVVDTATYFSLFGQIVILMLIQIGGLGIVAITSFIFLLLGKKINLTNRIAIKESLNRDNIQGVVKFIKKVLIVTLCIELIGALLLLYSTIKFTGSFWNGLFKAVFLSISAFCNAGFDIFGTESTQFFSLYNFANNICVLLPIMLLIVLGGIGFVVLLGGLSNVKHKQHIKIVMFFTLTLIFGGAALFLLFEWRNPNTIANMSIGEKILNAFFQSITLRTAGFATIDQGSLTKASQILSMFLMFIGGSPNSTAGGIKTTTFVLLFIFLFKRPNEQGDITFKNRRISNKIFLKVFKIIFSALIALSLAVILIALIDNNLSFTAIVFECISALSTVGVTMGITTSLSIISKLIIVVLMFVGRVGLTTIALAITPKYSKEINNIQYQNTDIIVG